MMDLKIDVKPEQIEQEIVKAIAASAFGKNLTEAVEKAIKGLGAGSWYNDELTKYVEREMRTIISTTITEKYAETIKQAIAKHINDEVLDGVIGKVTSKVLDNLKLSDRW